MEQILHRANSLHLTVGDRAQWDRFEVDVRADRERILVRHDTPIGPFTIKRRAAPPPYNWLLPVLGIRKKDLCLDEYIRGLPHEDTTLYPRKFINELPKERSVPKGGKETYRKTPSLLVDLKGSWTAPQLKHLSEELGMGKERDPQIYFDIFCGQNWEPLDMLRENGTPALQIAYSVGRRSALEKIAERTNTIMRICVDYRIIHNAQDLDPFQEQGVKIFLWGLPKHFYSQKLFRDLQDRGHIAGLTLDEPLDPGVEL